MEEQLIKFLQKTQVNIAKGKIVSEKDFENFAFDTDLRENLFRLMGFAKDDVQVKPKRIYIGPGTAWFTPDYILQCNQKDVIVFDVKKPGEDLNKHIYQIVSYCEKTNTPLGILFNGTDIHVFANTQFPGLRYLSAVKCPKKEYKRFSSTTTLKKAISFHGKPIAMAEEDPKKLVSILLNLSKSSLEQKSVIAIASSLALNRRKDIARKAALDLYDKAVANQLNKIISKPSQATLQVIKENNKQLSSLNPTLSELRRNWNFKSH